MSNATKKMLAAGAAAEAAKLAKAKEKPAGNTLNPTAEEISSQNQNDLEDKESKPNESKHPGGRPTLESKGKKKRKQYTLTLAPDFYETIMTFADFDGLSFSKYIERAVNEYMDNHK